MRELLHFATRRAQELVDITESVAAVVRRSGIADGLVGASETIPLIDGQLLVCRPGRTSSSASSTGPAGCARLW